MEVEYGGSRRRDTPYRGRSRTTRARSCRWRGRPLRPYRPYGHLPAVRGGTDGGEDAATRLWRLADGMEHLGAPPPDRPRYGLFLRTLVAASPECSKTTPHSDPAAHRPDVRAAIRPADVVGGTGIGAGRAVAAARPGGGPRYSGHSTLHGRTTCSALVVLYRPS